MIRPSAKAAPPLYPPRMAWTASASAVSGWASTLLEDFRGDLAKITVPVLVVQGGKDRAGVRYRNLTAPGGPLQ